MKNTPKSTKPITADQLAHIAEEGGDVSRHFTNQGRMMPPLALAIQRVNVDFTISFLEELDSEARELNVSRQAVIKTLLRQALDQHYAARSHRSLNHREAAAR